LEAGPPMCHTIVFPNEIDTQPGETTLVSVITCGGQGAVVFTSSVGTITPQPSSDPDVSVASFSIPDDSLEPDTATITVTSSDGVSTSEVEIQKVKLKNVTTANAQGDTGGRLNPDGGTTFVLTGKRDFPAVLLRVIFRQGDLSVPVDIPVNVASRPVPTQLVGAAPANTLFVGDAEVLVFADSGTTKVSKKTLCDDTGCSAYYAFDPASPPTSVGAPGGFNRAGGTLTINGGGFRRFDSTLPGAAPVLPRVNLDSIGFDVTLVTNSTINGNVQRAGPEFQACVRCGVGQQPCKFIHVRNPGGRAKDTAHSLGALYTLLPGPAPIPQSRFPDNGPSIGGTPVTIKGENLDFVDNVTIGGTNALIVSKTGSTIVITSPPHGASPGSQNPITLFDIDCAAPGGTAVSGGGFTYQLTPVTPIPGTNIYIVGPGEGVGLAAGPTKSASINCISQLSLTLSPVAPPPQTLPGVQAFRAAGSYQYCGCTQIGSITGTISYTLSNTGAAQNSSLQKTVTRSVTINPYNGIGSCNGSF